MSERCAAVPSDAESVGDQLLGLLRQAARVRRHRQFHPFGSTVAVEWLADVELPSKIEIPIETDTLPASCRLRFVKHGADIRVECRLRGVAEGKAVYESTTLG